MGNNTNNLAGIVGLLGVVFVTLKLTGVINWSWLWVTAPFWMPLGLGLSFALIAFLIGVVFIWLRSRK